MNTTTKLGAYALGLVALFGGAAGAGKAIGPVGTTGANESHGHADDRPAVSSELPDGLSASLDGYLLRLDRATAEAGRVTDFGFVIDGPKGTPVVDYTETHEKQLHLIVVRRDLAHYQHLHPERDARGRWSVPLAFPEPGTYKVFADFAPDGKSDAITLAADVSVAGAYSPRPLPAPATTTTVDGYTVTMTGALRAGSEAGLSFTVTRGGTTVTDIEPYLGARGHLVVLRASDLAYLHVHPTSNDAMAFAADVPSAGDFRLFLEFQHGGVVRTAAFTAGATR